MPLYHVLQARFYPAAGEWKYPGDTVELDEAHAEELMRNDATLLAPLPARRKRLVQPRVTRSAKARRAKR
jgi:hypothetical protein